MKQALNVTEAISKAKESLPMLTNREFHGVTGISKEGNEWKVTLELIERKSIPDSSDLLGVYELRLDEEGGIVSFNRSRLRRRGDTEELGKVV
ncbi:MAG: gas vesicle protein GvpO [Candidatus Bathyarchaeota archaeon]